MEKPQPPEQDDTLDSPVQAGESHAVLIVRVLLLVGLCFGGYQIWLMLNRPEVAGRQPVREVAAPASMVERTPAQRAPMESIRAAPLTKPPASRFSSLPMLMPGGLLRLAPLSNEAMDVQLGPGATVVVASKYAVMRYPAGDPASAAVVFDRKHYRRAFAQQRMQAMSSALALDAERILLGGWHGEVLLADARGLQRLSSREQVPAGRIHRMVRWRGQAYLAGQGLWRVNRELGRLDEIAAFAGKRLRVLTPWHDQLIVATGRRVWLWDGEDRRLLIDGWPAAGQITAIRPARSGGLWIMGTRGLWLASEDGQQLELRLANVWLTDLVETQDQLWLASWRQGLLLREQDRWYRHRQANGLAANAVSALALDGHDHMCITLYGGGAWHASRTRLSERLRAQPWTPQADPQQ